MIARILNLLHLDAVLPGRWQHQNGVVFAALYILEEGYPVCNLKVTVCSIWLSCHSNQYSSFASSYLN